MTVSEVQEVLQVAVGGMTLSTSVEGLERFPMRVRYARELRDNPDDIKRILIPAMNGVQIPLGKLLIWLYPWCTDDKKWKQFPGRYVIFDKIENMVEVDVVKEADKVLKENWIPVQLFLPAGVTYKFAGNYEHEVRATKRLAIVVPLVNSDFSFVVFSIPHNYCIIQFTSPVSLLHSRVDL